jgi:hypothetical protein
MQLTMTDYNIGMAEVVVVGEKIIGIGDQIRNPITGFWGILGYYALNIGRYDGMIEYRLDGTVKGIAPIHGYVPTPAKAIQTGGHIFNQNTLKVLKLTKEQAKKAIEALKKFAGKGNNFHGKIMSNGDVLDDAGRVIGNIYDFIF